MEKKFCFFFLYNKHQIRSVRYWQFESTKSASDGATCSCVLCSWECIASHFQDVCQTEGSSLEECRWNWRHTLGHWFLWSICFVSCTVKSRWNNKVFQRSWKCTDGLSRYCYSISRGKKVKIALNSITHLTGWWLRSREQTALWDDLPKWNSLACNQYQALHYVVWGEDQEDQCNSEVSVWAMQKPVDSGVFLSLNLKMDFLSLTEDGKQLPNVCASPLFQDWREYIQSLFLFPLIIQWGLYACSTQYKRVLIILEWMMSPKKKNLFNNKIWEEVLDAEDREVYFSIAAEEHVKAGQLLQPCVFCFQSIGPCYRCFDCLSSFGLLCSSEMLKAWNFGFQYVVIAVTQFAVCLPSFHYPHI